MADTLSHPRRRLPSFSLRAVLLLVVVIGMVARLQAEIPQPGDAPQPLSPQESSKRFQAASGFRVELVASEPLICEPSGVCWDAQGRMFVCELHGYNLEGQYDIEELNKSGELDHVVRRLDANPQAKRAAEAGTYGTVKLLIDTDRDGQMDKATTWADRLPPCYGICPARDGIIVACAPDIVFLADRDGDGVAEVRENLFSGFATGALERGINCPQWGLDGWIYFGRGHGGGKISGPHLAEPVELPRTDFRIKSDGSAIEPVGGGTQTIGFALTERGDRIVTNTNVPGIQIAPLAWRYLARNRDVAIPALEQIVGADSRTYPTSRPHPWRTRRAGDPGFAKFYTDRYGVSESTPNGYFTSACSPLVYQDQALPGLTGHLLTCEPAQNMVHREIISRDGAQLRLSRAPGEERAEFLTSTDTWFHPIAMAHAPDGNIYITDFYREIIEDYSAIPRYLQQQYELTHGQDRGRIWRLTHQQAAAAPAADMSRLKAEQLAAEVASPIFWRRETARRLLSEQKPPAAVPGVTRLVRADGQPAAVLNALYTLDAMQQLKPEQVLVALTHGDPGVRVHGLRLAETWLDRQADVSRRVLSMVDVEDDGVALQLALSLGESGDPRALSALAQLARRRGDARWMNLAVLSSLSGRGAVMLDELLGKPGELAKADRLLGPLCAMIGASRSADALSSAIAALDKADNNSRRVACLQGLRSAFTAPTRVSLTAGAVHTLESLASSGDVQVADAAKSLVKQLKLESDAQRNARIAKDVRDLTDIQLPLDMRLSAVADLAAENDPQVTAALVQAVAGSTPRVRDAILSAIYSRRDRLPSVAEALAAKTLPASALSAAQRAALLEYLNPEMRERTAALLDVSTSDDPQIFARYAAALAGSRDRQRGEKLFREKCGVCHQAHGVGVAVGPDLNAEFRRAEETIIRDILTPSSSITAGFNLYSIVTTEGQVFSGLLAVESANSLTLKQAEGKTQTILRKDVDQLRASPLSLMPDDLAKTLTPQDIADILDWLRWPPDRVVLLDEDASIVAALNEGAGTAQFIDSDAKRGQFALEVTPPQRFSAAIAGWQYRIRERPGPGEYRYLQFAWKASGATGVMIELADGGKWPPPNSPLRRYLSGKNTTAWQAVEIASEAPRQWTVVVRDLWKDFGDMTITGIAPTACGGPALFDGVELLRVPPE